MGARAPSDSLLHSATVITLTKINELSWCVSYQRPHPTPTPAVSASPHLQAGRACRERLDNGALMRPVPPVIGRRFWKGGAPLVQKQVMVGWDGWKRRRPSPGSQVETSSSFILWASQEPLDGGRTLLKLRNALKKDDKARVNELLSIRSGGGVV